MAADFYQDALAVDSALRFGDVVRGFVTSTPLMDYPLLDNGQHDYQVDVRIPELCVILSPCCSIADKTISLTPLKRIVPSFFDNPYLAEDMTNINRKMLPEQALPPLGWTNLPEEERQKRLVEGLTYAFVSFFVYTENLLLPSYSIRIRGRETATRLYVADTLIPAFPVSSFSRPL